MELHRQHLHLIGCKTKFNQDKQVCVWGGRIGWREGEMETGWREGETRGLFTGTL